MPIDSSPDPVLPSSVRIVKPPPPPPPPPEAPPSAGDADDEDCPEIDIGKGLTAQIVYMTVAVATEFLRHLLPRQRRIKGRHLACLKDDVVSGRWRSLNGETVIFDNRGRMIDGQHRATMVIQTGIPIWVIVIRNVDPDPATFISVGGQSKRTGADALTTLGHENAKVVSSAALLLWKYENGLIQINASASPMAISDVIARHPELPASAAATGPCRSKVRSAGTAAFCHYVFSQLGPDKFGRLGSEVAPGYFHKLATGEDMSRGDPVLALRRRLDEETFDIPTLLWLMFKVWNHVRQNKTIQILKIYPQEEFPDLI
jgi:hypothetical protein